MFCEHNSSFRLDDPLDAVAVHGGGGLVGVIAQPFFAFGKGIFWTSAGWQGLGVNIAGLLAIFAWSGFWSMVIFGGLKVLNILRIDRDTEFRGNDTVKHGEAAYPVDAWVSRFLKYVFSEILAQLELLSLCPALL